MMSVGASGDRGISGEWWWHGRLGRGKDSTGRLGDSPVASETPVSRGDRGGVEVDVGVLLGSFLRLLHSGNLQMVKSRVHGQPVSAVGRGMRQNA